MTGNFLCGALASAAADLAWRGGGWLGVCALGGGLSLLGLLAWLDELRGSSHVASDELGETAAEHGDRDRRVPETVRAR